MAEAGQAFLLASVIWKSAAGVGCFLIHSPGGGPQQQYWRGCRQREKGAQLLTHSLRTSLTSPALGPLLRPQGLARGALMGPPTPVILPG